MTERFPVGACDTHMHFYDGRYPIAPTTVLRPPDATATDYRVVREELGLERVVVVQPTTYGIDNSCQIDGAAEFGDRARLVVVVDAATPDAELERLHSLGAIGARFHMLLGGAVGWEDLRPVAERIATFGWHVQLQMDGNLLGERADQLLALPAPLVIDHVGRFMPPPAPDDARFTELLRLIDAGRCWVKLSAPYESTHDDAPHYPTVTRLVERLVEQFPERLLWASNWPHPGQQHPLSAVELRSLASEWLPSTDLQQQVLVDNPVEVYGFDRPPQHPRPQPEQP